MFKKHATGKEGNALKKNKKSEAIPKRHKNIDEENDTNEFPIQKSRNDSRLSVKTLDLYDPYDYREGHLTNFQAWAHIVKCSFGTGVLTMPMGFKHAGIIPGLVIGILIGGFCIHCILMLIKSSVHIAARQRQPYMPFGETFKYTFEHGFPACMPLSKCVKTFTELTLCSYHFGICTAYMNYLTQTTLIISGWEEHVEGYNWPTVVVTLAWVPFVCLINSIRNLRYLSPVSYLGNILTVASMGIIMYYIFKPDKVNGFLSKDWKYFGELRTIPLYIGIILFAVEAFGVLIAVERDMKTPRDFVGWFGVFSTAMVLVISWYIFLGLVGYLKFGQSIKSSVSLTIRDNQWPAATMYAMLALSLYCSYPLHCFVCVDIIWNQKVLPKLTRLQIFWEIIFRCGVVLLSAIVSILIPQLDLIVSLTGAVCLSFLGIMMPGIMEYNVIWSKYGMQWTFTMIKDIGIVILGIFAFVIGTYGAIYGFVSKAKNEQAAKGN